MSVGPEGATSIFFELDVVNYTQNGLNKQDDKEHYANDRVIAANEVNLGRRLLSHPHAESECRNVHNEGKYLE